MAETTNDKIYDLVNQTRIEINGNVQRVDAKVDALISGRLSRAEDDINKLKVKDATLDVKVYVLVFITSTVISAVISAVALKYFGAGVK